MLLWIQDHLEPRHDWKKESGTSLKSVGCRAAMNWRWSVSYGVGDLLSEEGMSWCKWVAFGLGCFFWVGACST